MTTAEAIFVLAIVGLAFAAYYFAVPQLGRLFAITALHGLRDRVFRAGLKVPKIRKTVMYRDMDAMLAYLVHIVRDEKYVASLAMLVVAYADQGVSETQRWRRIQYRNEMAELAQDPDPECFAALEAVIEATSSARGWMALRVATGHPLALVTALCAVVGVAAARATRDALTPVDRLATLAGGIGEPKWRRRHLLRA